MSDEELAACANCGAPLNVEGWVVTVGPRDGAVLGDDHVCAECGTAFWYDHDDPGTAGS